MFAISWMIWPYADEASSTGQNAEVSRRSNNYPLTGAYKEAVCKRTDGAFAIYSALHSMPI